MVWTATSGSGVTGGSHIEAVAGDTLTRDILVTPSLTTTAAGLSYDYLSTAGSVLMANRAGIDAINDSSPIVSWTLTDPVNTLAPASATHSGGTLVYAGGAVTCPFLATGNTMTVAGYCGAYYTGTLTPNAGFPPVDQGGGILGSFITNNSAPGGPTALFTLGRANFEVVPEPATGALLALGLGALVFIGRHRA
jgi:hypothetical protein